MSNRDQQKKGREEDKPKILGFFGVGLDNKDGQQRLTHSEHFLLIGGSQETHEKMQDTAIRFDEALQRRGKPLVEASPEEVIDLFREAQE